MNQQNRITLFNIPYTVEIVDEIDEGSRDRDGAVIYDKQLIRIKRNKPEYMYKVYLHEIMHIIFEHYEIKHDERQIELLANGLFEFLVRSNE